MTDTFDRRFDPRTTGNIYPRDDFKPLSRRTLASRDKAVLVDNMLELQQAYAAQLDWTRAALDQLRIEREVIGLVRQAANATIKAYEEAFDAKDAQIAALTAALVATRPNTSDSRVEVAPSTGVYQRTDTWNDRRRQS